MRVTNIRDSNVNIGLLARNTAAGPEKDLIEAFEEFVPKCFRWKSGSVAVFHEPQMETGFPPWPSSPNATPGPRITPGTAP